MPGQPNPEKDEPVKLPLEPEEALRALLQVKPDEAGPNVEDFVARHPELVPTMRAMLAIVERADGDPTRSDEFCREWLAAEEPSTPRRLTAFVKAGIIRESPKGPGDRRVFYVLLDRPALEAALRGPLD